MDCREIKSQLGVLLDHELEPAQTSIAQRHLAHCIECRCKLERLRALKNAMQNVELPMASAALDERVMEAFRLRHKRGRAQNKISVWRVRFFNSFAIPKPALAMISALLVTAVTLAYKAGEITGTKLQVVTPPITVLAPPPQSIEPSRIIYIKTAVGCPRPYSKPSLMLAHKGSIKTTIVEPAVKFETRSYDSDQGIYMTSKASESIEPVKDANVQIIKGGNQ